MSDWIETYAVTWQRTDVSIKLAIKNDLDNENIIASHRSPSLGETPLIRDRGRQVLVAAQCVSGAPKLAAVKFWLGWLEEFQARGLGEAEEFGSCAFGLVNLAMSMDVDTFADTRRNFTCTLGDQLSAPEELLGEYTVEEVAEMFSKRMYALEEAELPLKLMSHVLIGFGLESHAAVEDRYVFH